MDARDGMKMSYVQKILLFCHLGRNGGGRFIGSRLVVVGGFHRPAVRTALTSRRRLSGSP
jgi:hypothetical protein